MDKVSLLEEFKVWDSYVCKNGNKFYLFGEKYVHAYNSRTSDQLYERILTWDTKSYINKAFCMIPNEERFIVANEKRIIMIEDAEGTFNKTGRLPLNSSDNALVSVRCVGDYVLCLVFDSAKARGSITLLALYEHIEILPLYVSYYYNGVTSPDTFDLTPEQILYLSTEDGIVWILNIQKILTEKGQQKSISLDNEYQYKICDDKIEDYVEKLQCRQNKIFISFTNNIKIFDTNFQLLETLSNHMSDIVWCVNETSDVLVTIRNYNQFEMIKLNEHKTVSIQFLSNVLNAELINTKTMLTDERQCYLLLLLDDHSIQLLDINGLSQNSLIPDGLYTKIKTFY
ncbi:unnamed protein product, partial [Didymodactylos carnosus]